MTWKGLRPLFLRLRPGLSLHGNHMLVSAQGMAEEEALDPAAGCISMIPESFELRAWKEARW